MQFQYRISGRIDLFMSVCKEPSFYSLIFSPSLASGSLLVRMVNFHDTFVITRDSCAYTSSIFSLYRQPHSTRLLTVSVLKLWHTVNGLYM
jgi:hypothetical protein